MKVLRRVIIVICIILLIPLLIISVPEEKYFYNDLKDKVKIGTAQVIEVNKKWKIDDSTIIIQRIISTNKNVYVRFRYVENKSGWSFPSNSIELYDDKGKKYMVAGEDIGKLWGEEGINEYDRPSADCKEIILKLQLYDRKMEFKIPYGRSKNE